MDERLTVYARLNGLMEILESLDIKAFLVANEEGEDFYISIASDEYVPAPIILSYIQYDDDRDQAWILKATSLLPISSKEDTASFEFFLWTRSLSLCRILETDSFDTMFLCGTMPEYGGIDAEAVSVFIRTFVFELCSCPLIGRDL
jgi:hypothetical protein